MNVGPISAFYIPPDYSPQAVLRSKEGGVATIWIVATLGPKSAARKITRKQILGVDVPKACQKIKTPDAPIALRLQSSLLYGVSRVYVQQCDFVLTDAQQAQSSLRALIKTARRSDIDMEVPKTRSQDLILGDDPTFCPDTSLDLNTVMSHFSTEASSGRSSLLSPHSQLSSATSGTGGDEGSLGLILPVSPSDAGEFFGALSRSSDKYGSAQHHARMRELLGEEDPLDLNPGFTIDEEGNLLATDDSIEQQDSGRRPTGVSLGSDSADLSRVRAELQSEQRPPVQPMDIDLNLGPGGIEDDIIMPDVEAFPPMVATSREEQEPPSESARAPQQRRSRAKTFIRYDTHIQISASELNAWSNDYVANMRNAAHEKRSKRATWVAKSNATIWTFGRGIGDMGAQPIMLRHEHPLAVFTGDDLQAALTDNGKRLRADEGGGHASEDRLRLRDRNGEEEMGRGDDLLAEDGLVMSATPEEPERGRGPEAPLEDISTQYPWSNIGSRQESIPSRGPFPSSAGGFGSSAARRSSAMPGAFERRGSRLTSASPLVGRSQHERYSSLELPAQAGEDEFPIGGGSSILGADDGFQLYGPAAGVSTQLAGESQWMKATLDAESNNFLDFVKTHHARESGDLDDNELASGTDQDRSTLFEELLPPAQHTKIVAAQALLHVLALATRGLLSVQQDEGYGIINLRLP